MTIPAAVLSPPGRHRPPLRQPATIDRPRLFALLDAALERNAVTIVSAPSGFGKTTVVSAWAVAGGRDVVWLTLGTSDEAQGHIDAGILAALASMARVRTDAALLAELVFSAPGVATADLHARVWDAVASVDPPIVLVIDEAQRALRSIADGLLGALVAAPPPGLRLVLVGTTPLELAMSRHVLNHLDAVVGAEALAFETPETAALAGHMASRADPRAVQRDTGGWPIAVRMGLLGGSGTRAPRDAGDRGLMGEYVRDVVLSSLPPELARFVVDAAVCDELTPRVAAALTDRPDAARLLAECRRLGLFLDRHEGAAGAVYRWHPLFARHCRALLEEEDPQHLAELHRRAAALLADSDPLAAVDHLLAVSDPDAATALILDSWVSLVVSGEPAQLEATCLRLPGSFADEPGILLVRACAAEVLGDGDVARGLFARAQATAPGGDEPRADRYARALRLARLLLVDDRAELIAASAEIRQNPAIRLDDASPRELAAIQFLLGWTDVRERVAPARAIESLTVAARKAAVLGDVALARRAQECLAYAYAWTGRITRARELVVALAVDDAVDDSAWRTYVGGGAEAAAGTVAYWAGDARAAEREFLRGISLSGGRHFGNYARAMLACNAAATRDARQCRRAALELQFLPTTQDKGVSWPRIRQAAVAVLEEAVGHRERAVEVAHRLRDESTSPLVAVLAAGVLRRAGDHHGARRLLRQHVAFAEITYLRAASLLTDAVTQWSAGDPASAHENCERALDIADDEGLRLFFLDADPELRELLIAHIAWGTQHESFLQSCLRPAAADSPLAQLSERERDVFEQLRTTLTTLEIANRLGVSVNTVKTHQRSIYRKLGVTSRREALRQYT